MQSADIALLTDRRYVAKTAGSGDWYLQNILADDGLLIDALAERGLTSQRVDWADPDVDWSAFRCVVFRTTWDYFERFAEFSTWLDRVSKLTRLCNPLPTVRWNLDKHYLADLGRQGIPVVPSRFFERGTTPVLSDVLEEAGWDETVIKPCVSGAARHTYRMNRHTASELQPLVSNLLQAESMMVQPFQDNIMLNGEDTLMVFAGQYSHAVRKVAKPGDFRVQDDHGGTVHPLRPTAEQVELAERAFAACNPLPLYGRVDMVKDNDGRLAIMELELIEPELWLRFHPPAAELFAEGIAGMLAGSD